MKDFAPVTGLVRANQALLAHADFAPKSVGELIALAKEKPGTISYGTSGVGSAGHVNIALLESMAGVKLQAGALSRHGARAQRRRRRPHPAHVGGRELGAAAVAQRPGQDARHRQRAAPAGIPEVPTVAESGLPGYEATTWFGLFTTAGTPRDVVLKINAEVQRLFNEEAFRKRFVEPLLYEVDDIVAGAVRRFHHRRNDEMGQGHPRRQSQGGLSQPSVAPTE